MLDFDDLAFSGPFPLVTRAWSGDVGDVPGVYVLRSMGVGGVPCAVPRAAGFDERGILDFGASSRLHGRLDDLRGACLSLPRSHRAGLEYSTYGFAANYPLETLHVDVLTLSAGADGKRLAEAIEFALLETYRWRFKDRPPLNGSAGKYNAVAAWLRSRGRVPRDGEGWLDLAGTLSGVEWRVAVARPQRWK